MQSGTQAVVSKKAVWAGRVATWHWIRTGCGPVGFIAAL